MLQSNLLCAVIALVTAVTISSAFANGYLTYTHGEITHIEMMKK